MFQYARILCLSWMYLCNQMVHAQNCDGTRHDEHICTECMTNDNPTGCTICFPSYITTADCENCGNCRIRTSIWIVLVLFMICCIIGCLCKCCKRNKNRYRQTSPY